MNRRCLSRFAGAVGVHNWALDENDTSLYPDDGTGASADMTMEAADNSNEETLSNSTDATYASIPL